MKGDGAKCPSCTFLMVPHCPRLIITPCVCVCVCVCVCELVSWVRFFVTPWTVAHQAPLSMGFSRQEYWSGLPFPPPGDLPSPGIKPQSPALQADPLPSEPPGKPYYNPDVSHGSTALSSVVCLPTLFTCLPFTPQISV